MLYDSPCIRHLEFTKLIESRKVVARGGVGEGNGELLFNGLGFSVSNAEKVLEVDGGDGCTTLRMCLMPLNGPFEK